MIWVSMGLARFGWEGDGERSWKDNGFNEIRFSEDITLNV